LKQLLTSWRAEGRCCEQGQNAAHHRSHSLPEEQKTGVISRIQMWITSKPLTSWRAKDRHCQQDPNAAIHGSHSLPGEPRTDNISKVQCNSPQKPLTLWRARTGIVSRVQTQLTMEATHKLGAKDRHCEKGPNATHHRSHSHAKGPRTDLISRVQMQLTTETTHFLESQGQVS